MSVIFIGLALYATFQGLAIGGIVAAVIAVSLFLFALVAPAKLARLNRLWFHFGVLLGRVVSPIVLGIMFFLLITPVAFMTRLLGRDALLLKKRSLTTYWVDRTPPGPSGESYRNQF
jgi:hypothetical protein